MVQQQQQQQAQGSTEAAAAAAAEASRLAAAGAAQQGATKTPEQIASEAAASSAAKVKPEGLDDNFWDATTGTVKTTDLVKDYTGLKTLKAQLDERAKDIGVKPEDYQFTLAPEFKGPDGQPIKIDEDAAALLRDFSIKNKLTKTEANEAMNLFVKRDMDRHVAEQESYKAFTTSEKAKLGANADARLNAVAAGLKGLFGDKAQPFINLSTMSAVAVEGFETMLRTSGAPAYNGGSGNGNTQTDTKGMSIEERIHYARTAQNAKGKAA